MEVYDAIIIGTGVVGWATAMYAARLGLKTQIVGEQPGGTIVWTDLVENYPGFKRISGLELVEAVREHALEYNPIEVNARVERIEKKDKLFYLYGEGYEGIARTVILATGTKHRKLDAKNIELFENKGVHYCALCDGAFYKGKEVAVVGGSDSAVKDVIVLAGLCKRVYIIARGENLRGEAPNLRKLEGLKNVVKILKNNVVEVRGNERLQEVVLAMPFEGKSVLKIDALFVAIGGIPRSEVAKGLGVELNEKGEIKINRNSETNIEGVFAAGDVTDTRFKQAITGVGEGVTAAYSAFKYISERF